MRGRSEADCMRAMDAEPHEPHQVASLEEGIWRDCPGVRQADEDAMAKLAKALLFALKSHGEATLDNGARVRVLPELVLRDVLEANGVLALLSPEETK